MKRLYGSIKRNFRNHPWELFNESCFYSDCPYYTDTGADDVTFAYSIITLYEEKI